MHAAGTLALEISPDSLGDEGHEGRGQTTNAFQDTVEGFVSGGLVGAQLALPESAAITTHIPVAELFHHEVRNALERARDVVGLHVPTRVIHQRFEAGTDPAIEQGEFSLGEAGSPSIEIGVKGQEAVGVSQGAQGFGVHLPGAALVELQGLPDGTGHGHVHTNGVAALSVEHFPWINAIVLRLAHLLALGVEHHLIDEHIFVGRSPAHKHRDDQQAVEPTARLVDALADEVRGDLILEKFFVLEGPMPLGEGHGARIEPGVDDLGHALHGLAGLWMLQFQLVDEGFVHIEVFGQSAAREFLQFFDAAHADVLAVLGLPDGKWRAPESVAAESPVDVPLKPIAEAVAPHFLRIPVHLVVGLDELVLELGGLDEPGRLGEVHERTLVPPAMGIGMLHLSLGVEQAAGLQVFHDWRIGRLEIEAGEGLHRGIHPAVGAHRYHEGQVLLAAHIVVVSAIGRRHMHDARAVLGADEVGLHHHGRAFALFQGHLIVKAFVFQAHQVATLETSHDLILHLTQSF